MEPKWWYAVETQLWSVHKTLTAELGLARMCGEEELATYLEGACMKVGCAIETCAQGAHSTAFG